MACRDTRARSRCASAMPRVKQLQLDVYGEVLDALFQRAHGGCSADDASWALECALLEHLETDLARTRRGHLGSARRPAPFHALEGDGVGRVRSRGQGCRGIRSRRARSSDGASCASEFTRTFASEGTMPSRKRSCKATAATSWTRALLLIPLVGFLPADDPRVRCTVAAIERSLSSTDWSCATTPTHDGRAAAREGAFLACSFWLADNSSCSGGTRMRNALFEHLLALRNDVGLLAEEYDTSSRRMLGNFPQAFSHVALINTAHNLEKQEKPAEQRSGKRTQPSRGKRKTAKSAS